MKIKIVGLIDVVDAINLGKKGAVEFHATLIDYAAQYIEGKEIAGSDAKEVGWFGVDEIGQLNLWEKTKQIIFESKKIMKIKN